MAKEKVKVPSVTEIDSHISSRKLKPVYFLFGEDSYRIDEAVKKLKAAAIGSEDDSQNDFDNEFYFAEDTSIQQVTSSAAAFPFSSDKKTIIYKGIEKIKDRKPLSGYVKNPSESTVLIISCYEKITAFGSDPMKSMLEKGFLYEVPILKGYQLVKWIVAEVKKNGKTITEENAQFLVEIVGEDRSLIDSQLQKFYTFLGDYKEINLEVVTSLSTNLKEYNIFDLWNAFGKRDKKKALKVALNMHQKGKEIYEIIPGINKYFMSLARIPELKKKDVPAAQAARIVGTYESNYQEYINAANYYNVKRLLKISRALVEADVAVKSTSIDHKVILTKLIAAVMQ